MDSSIMPRECARLGERKVAHDADEGSQIDMSLVVYDQACALRKRSFAYRTFLIEVPALKLRLL